MKALGKDSFASLVEVFLIISWYALWACGFFVIIAALLFGLIPALVEMGLIGGDFFSSAMGRVPLQIVVPAFLGGSLVIGGALIIVWRLRRLFTNFSSGQPFARENAGHLRVIWITMLVIEIARYALLAAVAAVFVTVGPPQGADLSFNVQINPSTWMSIAVLIVLAEVFREGARLREEQELTI